MNKLSTGQPSTLKSYMGLCNLVFGKNSKQSQFIQSKISESIKGEDEEVIANESQMINLLVSLT